jgi:hypothetical protein
VGVGDVGQCVDVWAQYLKDQIEKQLAFVAEITQMNERQDSTFAG